MSKISLSVCIPTYNRIDYLKESLSGLLPQAEQVGAQVCVSDNASSDGTGDLLKSLSSRYKCLRYVIHPTNLGLDRNMIAVMAMANTDYILPIGDDEIIVDDALSIINNELIGSSPDLVIFNGYYVSSDLKNNTREHLPTELQNRFFSDPIQAFSELWNKMPLGSFVVKSECLLLGDHQGFTGTSHAYTGVVWEYLAGKFRSCGEVNVKCLSQPVILFRQGEKSWRLDAAKIMLHEIPLWFSKLPHEYQQQITDRILPRYLSDQSRYINLLHYRAMGQLNAECLNNFMLTFSDSDRRKASLIASIPVSIAKIAVVVTGILRKAKTKIKNLMQARGEAIV